MGPVILTVALAFVGYLATYLNGLRLAQRQAHLARVNQQLSDFYGPLFALMEANSRAYDAFCERYVRPDGIHPFDHDFLPNIQKMRDVVVTKADLLMEEEMPPVLLELCAHVSGYEITAARWAHDDFHEYKSVIPFPGQELRKYATTRFAQLKKEQAILLGRRR